MIRQLFGKTVLAAFVAVFFGGSAWAAEINCGDIYLSLGKTQVLSNETGTAALPYPSSAADRVTDDDEIATIVNIGGYAAVSNAVCDGETDIKVTSSGNTYAFRVVATTVVIEKTVKAAEDANDKSNATIRIVTHVLNKPKPRPAKVLFFGTGCGAHELSAKEMVNAINAISKVGSVDWYFFKNWNSSNHGMVTNNVIAYNGKELSEKALDGVMGATDKGNHYSLKAFYDQFEKIINDASKSNYYDYVVIETDGSRIANEYGSWNGTDTDADKQRGGKRDVDQEKKVAAWLRPYYESGKVVWIMDDGYDYKNYFDDLKEDGVSHTGTNTNLFRYGTDYGKYRVNNVSIKNSGGNGQWIELVKSPGEWMGLKGIFDPMSYLDGVDYVDTYNVSARTSNDAKTASSIVTKATYTNPNQLFYGHETEIGGKLKQLIKPTTYETELQDTVLNLANPSKKDENLVQIRKEYADHVRVYDWKGGSDPEQWPSVETNVWADATLWEKINDPKLTVHGLTVSNNVQNITNDCWRKIEIDIQFLDGFLKAAIDHKKEWPNWQGIEKDKDFESNHQWNVNPNEGEATVTLWRGQGAERIQCMAAAQALAIGLKMEDPGKPGMTIGPGEPGPEEDPVTHPPSDQPQIPLADPDNKGSWTNGARSVVKTYDGIPTNILVYVKNPQGATLRYSYDGVNFKDASTFAGYTAVTNKAPVWYEATAEGYQTITNRAFVTITAKPLTNSVPGLADSGVIACPTSMVYGTAGVATTDLKWYQPLKGLVAGHKAVVSLGYKVADVSKLDVNTYSGYIVTNALVRIVEEDHPENDVTENYDIAFYAGALKVTPAPIQPPVPEDPLDDPNEPFGPNPEEDPDPEIDPEDGPRAWGRSVVKEYDGIGTNIIVKAKNITGGEKIRYALKKEGPYYDDLQFTNVTYGADGKLGATNVWFEASGKVGNNYIALTNYAYVTITPRVIDDPEDPEDPTDPFYDRSAVRANDTNMTYSVKGYAAAPRPTSWRGGKGLIGDDYIDLDPEYVNTVWTKGTYAGAISTNATHKLVVRDAEGKDVTANYAVRFYAGTLTIGFGGMTIGPGEPGPEEDPVTHPPAGEPPIPLADPDDKGSWTNGARSVEKTYDGIATNILVYVKNPQGATLRYSYDGVNFEDASTFPGYTSVTNLAPVWYEATDPEGNYQAITNRAFVTILPKPMTIGDVPQPEYGKDPLPLADPDDPSTWTNGAISVRKNYDALPTNIIVEVTVPSVGTVIEYSYDGKIWYPEMDFPGYTNPTNLAPVWYSVTDPNGNYLPVTNRAFVTIIFEDYEVKGDPSVTIPDPQTDADLLDAMTKEKLRIMQETGVEPETFKLQLTYHELSSLDESSTWTGAKDAVTQTNEIVATAAKTFGVSIDAAHFVDIVVEETLDAAVIVGGSSNNSNEWINVGARGDTFYHVRLANDVPAGMRLVGVARYHGDKVDIIPEKTSTTGDDEEWYVKSSGDNTLLVNAKKYSIFATLYTACTPQLTATIKWKFAQSMSGFCPALDIACTNGDQTAIRNLAFVYEDRDDYYLCDPETGRKLSETSSVICGGKTFGKALLGSAIEDALRTAALSTVCRLGVSDATLSSSRYIVPHDERNIFLYTPNMYVFEKKKSSVVEKALGYLTWQEEGSDETYWCAVGLNDVDAQAQVGAGEDVSGGQLPLTVGALKQPSDVDADVVYKKARKFSAAVIEDGAVVGTANVSLGKIKKGKVKMTVKIALFSGKSVSANQNLEIDENGGATGLLNFKDPVGTMSADLEYDTETDVCSLSAEGEDYRIVAGDIGGAIDASELYFSVDFDELEAPTGFDFVEDALPSCEPIYVKNGSKWSFDKVPTLKFIKDEFGDYVLSGLEGIDGKTNMSGLKLSYNKSTGLFSGSFKIYATDAGSVAVGRKPTLKKYTAKVKGAVIDGSGYGVVTVKIGKDTFTGLCTAE